MVAVSPPLSTSHPLVEPEVARLAEVGVAEVAGEGVQVAQGPVAAPGVLQGQAAFLTKGQARSAMLLATWEVVVMAALMKTLTDQEVQHRWWHPALSSQVVLWVGCRGSQGRAAILPSISWVLAPGVAAHCCWCRRGSKPAVWPASGALRSPCAASRCSCPGP